jgi:hypothetical protein
VGVGLLELELCANACCCAERLAGAMRESLRRKWEKKEKKCCDRVKEKRKIKLVRELMSEYYSSKLVSIFTHQNFLIKVVRLLGVVF